MRGYIDTHTHIGIDEARRKLNMSYEFDGNLLLELASNNNVSEVILMPALGQIVCPDLGKLDHKDIYGSEGIPNLVDIKENMVFQCVCGRRWSIDDPLKEANEYMFEESERLNSYGKVLFHPVPWIHPLKPGIGRDIKEFYNTHAIKGVKINAFIDKIDPRNYIKSELADVVKELDLRILFHTDYEPPALPSNCLEFAIKTGIKCQLAHGCFGERESLERVSEIPNVILDVSPIEQYYKSILVEGKKIDTDMEYLEYLEYVISLCGDRKVVAGSNFYWCGWTPNSYSKLWEDFKVLSNENILYRNAKTFWGL